MYSTIVLVVSYYTRTSSTSIPPDFIARNKNKPPDFIAQCTPALVYSEEYRADEVCDADEADDKHTDDWAPRKDRLWRRGGRERLLRVRQTHYTMHTTSKRQSEGYQLTMAIAILLYVQIRQIGEVDEVKSK